jgi:protein-S-isoprenylcysteine O-methyltransferase Ste14
MTDTSKNWLVKTGDFIFKWRNYMFPVILVGLLVPFPVSDQFFGHHYLEEWKDLFAIIVVLSGLAFRCFTIGWAYIKRGGLNKQVYADTLVRSGFFGMCRNPLYVGNFLIYAGIFILHGNFFVVFMGIALFTFIYIAIVAAEEHYLRNKFGAEYEQYCVEVPRWIPDFSKYKVSTEGMNFSVRRSIFKDYSTIFNAVLAMAFIETLERLQLGPTNYFISFALTFSLFGASALMLVVVKYLKKTTDVKV